MLYLLAFWVMVPRLWLCWCLSLCAICMGLGSWCVWYMREREIRHMEGDHWEVWADRINHHHALSIAWGRWSIAMKWRIAMSFEDGSFLVTVLDWWSMCWVVCSDTAFGSIQVHLIITASFPRGSEGIIWLTTEIKVRIWSIMLNCKRNEWFRKRDGICFPGRCNSHARFVKI